MAWKHISGVVQVTGPEGPEGPVDPGWGNRPPTDPDYGHPDIGAGRPGHDLPSGPIHIGGGPIKPPGRPVLPPSIDNGLPPNGGAPPHAWRPGHWEILDPGDGKPPLWGWILGPDNGLPAPPVYPGGGPVTPPTYPGGGPVIPPPVISGGPVVPPPTTKPTPPGQGGVWVPTDPDYGKPVRPCPPAGGRPHPPIWAWVPDRPEFPPPTEGGTTGVNIWPESATVLASGGTVTVSVSVYPGGSTLSWSVMGLPGWVTAAPASGNASAQVVLTAAANSTGIAQQAFISINDKVFTLNQGAV